MEKFKEFIVWYHDFLQSRKLKKFFTWYMVILLGAIIAGGIGMYWGLSMYMNAIP